MRSAQMYSIQIIFTCQFVSPLVPMQFHCLESTFYNISCHQYFTTEKRWANESKPRPEWSPLARDHTNPKHWPRANHGMYLKYTDHCCRFRIPLALRLLGWGSLSADLEYECLGRLSWPLNVGGTGHVWRLSGKNHKCLQEHHSNERNRRQTLKSSLLHDCSRAVVLVSEWWREVGEEPL